VFRSGGRPEGLRGRWEDGNPERLRVHGKDGTEWQQDGGKKWSRLAAAGELSLAVFRYCALGHQMAEGNCKWTKREITVQGKMQEVLVGDIKC